VTEHLTEKAGGLLSEARIAFEACPLCGSPAFQPFRSADCSRHALYDPRLPPTIDWMRCDVCTHVFTSGSFTAAAAAIVLSRAHAFQLPGQDYERRRPIAARIAEQVCRFVAPDGPWLDVGFGDGALLLTAEEFGFAPVGVDIRPAAVAALQAIGVEAYAGDFLKFVSVRKFRVVSLMDVLEHLPFPGRALTLAASLLAPGGVLIVSCPAYDSPAWRALDAVGENPYWGELEHYHNFSRARLSALLRQEDFEPCGYAVSQRYRACMEIVATRGGGPAA